MPTFELVSFISNFLAGLDVPMPTLEPPKNDTFEYHPNDTIYQARREDINGTEWDGGMTTFETLWDDAMSDINDMVVEYNGFIGR